MNVHKVFVYGTLKEGEPNHHWLTDSNNGKSEIFGNGKTKEKYPLVIGTRYNIPFLLFQQGLGHNVLGEIYKVDDVMLEKLDELEDHPHFYERQKEDILLISEDLNPVSTHCCWVYFLKRFRPELLTFPMLECYMSKGDHGLPYCERYLRDPKYFFQKEVLPWQF